MALAAAFLLQGAGVTIAQVDLDGKRRPLIGETREPTGRTRDVHGRVRRTTPDVRELRGTVRTVRGRVIALPRPHMKAGATVHFAFKVSARFKREPPVRLVAFAHALSSFTPVRVDAIGHADAVGNEEDNLLLSMRRARTVCRRLERFLGARVKCVPHARGETEPVASNCTADRRDNRPGRAHNRRVLVRPAGKPPRGRRAPARFRLSCYRGDARNR